MRVVLIANCREEKEGAEFFHLRTEPANLFPLLFPSVLYSRSTRGIKKLAVVRALPGVRCTRDSGVTRAWILLASDDFGQSTSGSRCKKSAEVRRGAVITFTLYTLRST
jgi:hypothetical protein